ncbi:alkene reductase [Streptomyces sp. NPDC051940]|uniref:alkene reductase n=1 Tax=Streptomyces sp. NPDC051940 TaxID=3155675 RepID=UPI0034476F92
MTNNIFETVRIGRHELPHRLVMAPMTRSRARCSLVDEVTAEYYEQRAGAALIITEGTQPSPRGQGYIDTPGIHSAEQIAAWRKVTDAVHAKGGVIFQQLMHTGRIGHPYLYADGGLPEAPSAVASGMQLFTADQGLLDHPEPRELELDDIARLIDEYTRAARNSIEAGFDGVELHGANGYLIHQFLSGNTNRRTDAYGGPVENRIRFAVELVQSVADAIGADRLGIRVSPGNTYNNMAEEDSAELYAALTEALAPYGLAYIHVLETSRRDITEQIRRDWPTAVILNPAEKPLEEAGGHASALLEAGLADAVSYARLWLANPDAHRRVRAGAPLNQDDPDSYYGGDHRGYTDYPALAD